MQQAGVSDKFYPGGFGGMNDVTVLRGTLTDFAGGDQQQFIHALQRGGQCRFVGIIGTANHNTLLAQRFGFAGLRTMATIWLAAVVLTDFVGRGGWLAGGAGNRDHQYSPSCCVTVVIS